MVILLMGRCIGMALLYGGSGPHFFPESVTSYIFNEPIDYSVWSDIPDYDIREKIDKVGQYNFILLHACVPFIVQYVEPPTTHYPKHKRLPYNNTSQSIIILLYFNLWDTDNLLSLGTVWTKHMPLMDN